MYQVVRTYILTDGYTAAELVAGSLSYVGAVTYANWLNRHSTTPGELFRVVTSTVN